MKLQQGKPVPSGQVRQSQLLSSYGPGSMLDLPEQSVVVSGLDFWKPAGRQVHEERLEAKVRGLLKRSYLTLRAPPTEEPERVMTLTTPPREPPNSAW